MSISNLLQPNNYNLAAKLLPAGFENQFLTITDESTKTLEWVNRSINAVFQSRNNTALSFLPASGTGKVDIPFPLLLELGGGYRAGPAPNEVIVNEKLASGGNGTPVHHCLITLVVRAVAPPALGMDVVFYVLDNVGGAIEDTEVHAKLMPDQKHSVVINAPITIGPNIEMSLYWSNNSPGSENIIIEDATWNMQFLGNEPL